MLSSKRIKDNLRSLNEKCLVLFAALRIRYNDEHLQRRSHRKTNKAGRVRWLGHVAPMDNNNVVKRVFDPVPVVARRPGRPAVRWKDSMMSDLKRLTPNIGEWTQIAANRRDWRRLIS
uniref:Uncharacterized protein n=1 Tax=Megaselia scalaris TaxID=36166 RepID=T1H3N6_MEGSC